MTKHDKIAANVPVQSVPRQEALETIWEPLARVRSDFDRLFEEFWHRPLGVGLNRRMQALSGPALELKDKGGEFELIAEVPGMKPEEIELKVSDGMLRLTGEKKEQRDESKEGYVFSERSYGRFERTVALPKGIDNSKITANARDGMLSIHLPKSPEALQAERKIEISA
jgi:HSP20 family protein